MSRSLFTPRQDLIERLQELPETSQKHVFQILKRKDIKYTENGNGVFFNLTACQDPEVWEALQRIVDQQTTMQRENQERENRIREMQELLRVGDRPSTVAAPPPAPQEVPRPPPAEAAPTPPTPVAPVTEPEPPKTSAAPPRAPAKPKSSKPAAPRDILSMLAK